MKRPGRFPSSHVRAAVAPILLSVLAACENPQPPVSCGAIPQQTITVGQTGTVSACFNDPNGDLLTYSAVSSNPGVAAASAAGSAVTVTAVAPGNASVTVTAADPDGLKGQQVFQVQVPNRPPLASGTIPAQTIIVGQIATVNLSSYFTEPDGQPLAYSATAEDLEVAAPAVSGSVLTVAAVAKGATNVTVTATDPGGLTAAQVFQVVVPNRAPVTVGTLPDQTLNRGAMVTVDLSLHFDDPDGDQLTYSATPATAGVVTLTVSGGHLVVVASDRGNTAIAVTARDPAGLTASQTFAVTVRNRPPVAVGAVPDQTVSSGETLDVDMSAYFTDPDGDSLTYDAVSSDPSTAAVTVDGKVVSIAGVAPGEATVTVVAGDPGGLHAQSSFLVTVTGADNAGFQIDLFFATPIGATHEAAFRDAADRWMSILEDTDLPDVTVNGTVDCSGEYEQSVHTIEDLMIVAAVVEIDGPGRVLGRAAPCRVRDGSSLPWFGMMEFDVADLERMERDGTLKAVILHEMAHVLGIGTLWRGLDLLTNPSLVAGREVDTHLPLPLAVEAFDQAGGVGYTGGGKVPVENKGKRRGSDDAHWRTSVLGTELMTPSISATSESSPLSEITLQSLADLGYTVDVSLAEPYRLPTGAALKSQLEDSIDLGNDVIGGPIVVTDRNGRTVRVIPPR